MHPRELSISDHSYDLPVARIAQQPLADRDSSKQLVYRKGVVTDHVFKELPDLLPKNALLLLNKTKVVNARILLQRATGARIEVLCLSPLDGPVEQAINVKTGTEWHCFIGNAKRWKLGEVLTTAVGDVTLHAERKGSERIAFRWEPADRTFGEVLEVIGHVPLPPYMDRADTDADKERYNTVFAMHDGSVAAPTASLHFSKGLLSRLQANGTKTADLVLHVGAGTFLPVKSDRMEGHTMHSEEVRIPLSTLVQILGHLADCPVIPVGTTSMRTLESVYWHGLKVMAGTAERNMSVGQWEPYEKRMDPLPEPRSVLEAVIDQVRSNGFDELKGTTELMIAPGYQFRFSNGLITNFHQPGSTLLLLVAALLGDDWRKVYAHALANDYRFLSYGDSSLLLP